MVTYKQRGPLNAAGHPPFDNGTRVLARSPVPAIATGSPRSSRLSDSDVAFIDNLFPLDGTTAKYGDWSIRSDLRLVLVQCDINYRQSVATYGVDSWEAHWNAALRDRLSQYIALHARDHPARVPTWEVRKQFIDAQAALRRYTDAVADGKAKPNLHELQKLLKNMLEKDAVLQKRGAADDPQFPRDPTLIRDALDITQRVYLDHLERGLQLVKNPGNAVSIATINVLVIDALGIERQRELLEVEDEDKKQRTTRVILEIADHMEETRKRQLRSVLGTATKPGSPVTRSQVHALLVEAVGLEAMRQGLGDVDEARNRDLGQIVQTASALYGPPPPTASRNHGKRNAVNKKGDWVQ